MINWSRPGNTGNNRGIYPLWPWEHEQVAEIEYEYALQGLERFLTQVNVEELVTLEDVSSAASLIGHNMRILAIVRGKKIERQVEQYEPETGELISVLLKEYILNKFAPDHEVVVTASQGHTLLSERRIVGFQGYQREELRVKLPSDKDIAIGNIPNVEDQSCYAIDLREGKRIEYHPVRYPEDARVQQGFANVIKAALHSIFTVLPEYRRNT